MVESYKRNGWRIFELIIQVILFNYFIYGMKCIFGYDQFSIRTFVTRIIPVNYYVILYCTTYLVSPYINIVLNALPINKLRSFVVGLAILFSGVPTIIDCLVEITGNNFYGLSPIGLYGSQYGYTIVNFILMYILGAALRKCMFFSRIKTRYCCYGILFSSITLVGWAYLNDIIGFGVERSAWEYCNPIVILESLLILTLFLRLKLGSINLINILSKATFTVYLLHSAFFKIFNFEAIFSGNFIVMIIKVTGIAMLIYGCCWVIDYLYRNTIMKALYYAEKRVNLSYDVGVK